MKQFFLLLILLGIGVWAYFHYYGGEEAPPPPREAHLAKPGTFFVLQYVSVPTANGIIGFEPGREVRYVRVDNEKGMLVVTDGQHEVEMRPSQLTNDLDIAAIARKGDEDSQHQITAFIEHEKAVYKAVTTAANVRYAQEIERATHGGKLVSPSPTATPEGSDPYSYFTSPH
jgi:hypothetical protein